MVYGPLSLVIMRCVTQPIDLLRICQQMIHFNLLEHAIIGDSDTPCRVTQGIPFGIVGFDK